MSQIQFIVLQEVEFNPAGIRHVGADPDTGEIIPLPGPPPAPDHPDYVPVQEPFTEEPRIVRPGNYLAFEITQRDNKGRPTHWRRRDLAKGAKPKDGRFTVEPPEPQPHTIKTLE